MKNMNKIMAIFMVCRCLMNNLVKKRSTANTK